MGVLRSEIISLKIMRIKNAGIKPLDILVFIAVLALCIWSAIAIYGARSGQAYLRIEGPEGSWLYPLSEDRIIYVNGPLGTTTIAIQDGVARFVASPCPNHSCLAGSPISKHGDWNACLPNHIMIRGEQKNPNSDIDIIAQ